MSLFSRLFGSKSDAPPEVEPVEHKGFRIYPDPMKEGARWRIAARIEKEVGGETRTHRLIRADVLDDREACAEASLGKARAVIDEQGDRLFG